MLIQMVYRTEHSVVEALECSNIHMLAPSGCILVLLVWKILIVSYLSYNQLQSSELIPSCDKTRTPYLFKDYLVICCSLEWDWSHAYPGKASCVCDPALGCHHPPSLPPPIPSHHRTGAHPTTEHAQKPAQHTGRIPCLHGEEQGHPRVS